MFAFVFFAERRGLFQGLSVFMSLISANFITDGIRDGCRGASRDYLESICMQLPEKDCLPALPMNDSKCTEDEFDCGDGQCVHGLQLCDHKFDCKSGADELKWLVSATF